MPCETRTKRWKDYVVKKDKPNYKLQIRTLAAFMVNSALTKSRDDAKLCLAVLIAAEALERQPGGNINETALRLFTSHSLSIMQSFSMGRLNYTKTQGP